MKTKILLKPKRRQVHVEEAERLEIVRRLSAGEGLNSIALSLGRDRATIRFYDKKLKKSRRSQEQVPRGTTEAERAAIERYIAEKGVSACASKFAEVTDAHVPEDKATRRIAEIKLRLRGYHARGPL